MKKIKESKKCSKCNKGYLKYVCSIDDKSFLWLFIPFMKVNILGYVFQCNNCLTMFEEIKK